MHSRWRINRERRRERCPLQEPIRIDSVGLSGRSNLRCWAEILQSPLRWNSARNQAYAATRAELTGENQGFDKGLRAPDAVVRMQRFMERGGQARERGLEIDPVLAAVGGVVPRPRLAGSGSV